MVDAPGAGGADTEDAAGCAVAAGLFWSWPKLPEAGKPSASNSGPWIQRPTRLDIWM